MPYKLFAAFTLLNQWLPTRRTSRCLIRPFQKCYFSFTSYNIPSVMLGPSHPPTFCQQFTIVPNYPPHPVSHTNTLSVSLTPSLSHTLLHVRCQRLALSLSQLSCTSGGRQDAALDWWVKGQSWRLAQQTEETRFSYDGGAWETGRGSGEVTGRALYNVRLCCLKWRNDGSIVERGDRRTMMSDGWRDADGVWESEHF